MRKNSFGWIHWIWSAYIVFSPLYLWASGLPQIADLLLAVGLSFLAFELLGRGHIPLHGQRNVVLTSAGFLLIVWLVSLSHALFGHIVVLWGPVRLTFVLFCFWLVAYAASRNFSGFIQASFWAYVAAAGLVVLWSSPESSRFVGTFNNPNQLAYFCIIGIAYASLAVRFGSVGVFPASVFVGGLVFLGSSSVSFAFLIVASLSVLTYLVVGLRFRIVRLGLLVFTLTIPMLFMSYFSMAQPIGFVERLSEVAAQYEKRKDNVLERKVEEFLSGDRMRGLEVFRTYPQMAIFGAGRGANERFGGSHEIHSSVPAVLYSYGILGAFSFSLFFIFIHRSVGPWSVVLVAPLWAWSFFHYSLNFPAFWGVYGILFGLAVFGRRSTATHGLRTHKESFKVSSQ